MKTMLQIAQSNRDGSLDGRDVKRLASYMTLEDVKNPEIGGAMGLSLENNVTEESWGEVKEFTEANVLKDLEEDLAFAFDKALNKRGLSAGAMHEVIKMWCFVLDREDLEEKADDLYAQYGLPFFKLVANTFGFKDEIEGYAGDEYIFSYESEDFFESMN